jgi:hypothetical protein
MISPHVMMLHMDPTVLVLFQNRDLVRGVRPASLNINFEIYSYRR